MGMDVEDVVRVDDFTAGQRQFLDFHRNSALLRAVQQ